MAWWHRLLILCTTMKSHTKLCLWRWLAFAAIALPLLGGCGGGSTGTSAPDNSAPHAGLTLGGEVRSGTTGADASATVGRDVLLNGAGSTDADGDALTFSWSVVSKPANSALAIAANSGAQVTVKPDVAGTYVFNLKVTDSKGSSSDQRATLVVDNTPPTSAPTVIVVGSVITQPSDGGKSSLEAAVGYVVSLNGGASIDPDGKALTYFWSLASKPAGSAAQLNAIAATTSQFSPDVLGDYVVKLTVTNSTGEASTYTTTVTVKNRRPVANISSNATPLALPSGPAIRLPVNTVLTLRGGASIDADGDAITYTWSITEKPAGSTAALSSTSAVNVQLTPDMDGRYVVQLRATDPAGAYSEQRLTINVGAVAPVAVVDVGNMTTLVGSSVSASAALSFDEDGHALSYSWALDAIPAGSAATIANPASATLSLTPDVPGNYVASVTVSDGTRSSIAYVNVRALTSIAGSVTLPFAPLDTRYSRGLDRMIIIATNPNALKIVDPFTGVIKSVALPMAVKSLQLSPDGKLAAVLHEGIVSLVDLQTATLLRSSATGGSHTDAFVTNEGIVYLIGQTGGQWVSPAVIVLNGRTGESLSTLDWGFGGYFYGTQKGVFSARQNKVFFMTNGLSPVDISFFTIDPKANKVLSSGDSPYHGDFDMYAPLYLSDSEDLVFTSSGTYFQASTLKYGGRLVLNSGRIVSLSNSLAMDETLAFVATGGSYPDYSYSYPSTYKRYTGALFLPAADLPLPVIGGQQSFGLSIFHSATGHHIALVQTGSAVQNAAGVQYFVTYR